MSSHVWVVRYLRAAILVLVLACALAAAPEDSGLAFVDEDPLELTLAQAKKGTNVAACNLGENELTGLNAKFVGFDTPVNQAIEQPTNIKDKLAVGDCVQVSVRVGDQLKPEEGT